MTKRSDLLELKKKIKKDSRYKKLHKLLNDDDIEQYNIPVNEYLMNAKTLHGSRKFRRLDPNSPNILAELTAAAVEDQSFRSQMTEILVVCSQAIKSIRRLLESFSAYATMTYQRELKALVGTVKEREAFIDAIFEDFHKYIIEVEALEDAIKLYIIDIDKAGYVMKNIAEVQRLVYRPELAGR